VKIVKVKFMKSYLQNLEDESRTEERIFGYKLDSGTLAKAALALRKMKGFSSSYHLSIHW
jgi:hypothetical protein